MQSITSLLINASRKPAKLLQRDFYELQMLQNSSRGTSNFCKQSYLRTKTLFQDELTRNAKHLFFTDEHVALRDDMESVILITPIDAMANLAKALPFFAIIITYLKQTQNGLAPIISVINFPALNEVSYAERGAGAWVVGDTTINAKGSRLRHSNCANLENAMIITDDLSVKFDETSLSNTRCFGSAAYDLMMFCGGKFDILYSKSTDLNLKHASSLMIREAGGTIIQSESGTIASNQLLAEKIKLTIA